MTAYEYTVPNTEVAGLALKIQNTGSIVNGIYSGSGVFLSDGTTMFPLITAGKDEIVDIPGNSVIYMYELFPVKMRFRENMRLVVESTSLPDTCIMTPILLVEMED